MTRSGIAGTPQIGSPRPLARFRLQGRLNTRRSFARAPLADVSNHMNRAKTVLIAMVIGASRITSSQATELDVPTLEAAEKRWAHASLQDYEFTFKYSEFISPCRSFTYRVRVSHGVPKRWYGCRQYWAEFSTVPLLFKFLRRALTGEHHSIEAEFDSTTGCPVSAYIDWSGLTDDFFSFEVANFRVDR